MYMHTSTLPDCSMRWCGAVLCCAVAAIVAAADKRTSSAHGRTENVIDLDRLFAVFSGENSLTV
jgi:hypothetical protein